MEEGAFPWLFSFWPRGEFWPNRSAGQVRVLMQTAAASLSCTLSISATECSTPQATVWPDSRRPAILHVRDFGTRSIRDRGADSAALTVTGIVSVMRRRQPRTVARSALASTTAHNATLCLGPLFGFLPARLSEALLFEAGLVLSGCAGRAHARHPNITLGYYAQRPQGSAVRRSGDRIIRAMFTCPRRCRARPRVHRAAVSPGASRRGSHAACRSTRACRFAWWRVSRDLTALG
jgi:hypothetical protein